VSDVQTVGQKRSIWSKLYRGETSFDFVGHRRRWYTISLTVILIGLIALGVKGLNFSIDFKGGTVWEVPASASVSHVRDVLGGVSSDLRQANIQILTDRQTGHRTVRVSAEANSTKDKAKVTRVTDALAKMAGVPANQVTLNDVGASWGHDITQKAVRALVIFLVAVVLYITFRFEGKMAIAALVALLHDILVTVGIYALSGFQVSPATVIAFLTILGYSLYDTIVVFDRVEENVKGIGASGRLTYSETVNLSMNQVLMRSINTSLVAILPILSILVIGSLALGASALQDFGLALAIGMITGAYSSIFIASPLLAQLKEPEPRYVQIRQRLATRAAGTAPLTPAAAAAGGMAAASGGGAAAARSARTARSRTPAAGSSRSAAAAAGPSDGDTDRGVDQAEVEPAGVSGGGGNGASPGSGSSGAGRPRPAPRPGNRPAPRPRKKGRRR
jgi:preprotein translocase subunit SecF